MKNEYADNPGQQLNVYVVDVLIDADGNGEPDYYGSGVYPWTSYATDALGGVLVDGDRFGSEFTLLTHKIGHVLGLWHTFDGTSAELMNHGGLFASLPERFPATIAATRVRSAPGWIPVPGIARTPTVT